MTPNTTTVAPTARRRVRRVRPCWRRYADTSTGITATRGPTTPRAGAVDPGRWNRATTDSRPITAPNGRRRTSKTTDPRASSRAAQANSAPIDQPLMTAATPARTSSAQRWARLAAKVTMTPKAVRKAPSTTGVSVGHPAAKEPDQPTGNGQGHHRGIVERPAATGRLEAGRHHGRVRRGRRQLHPRGVPPRACDRTPPTTATPPSGLGPSHLIPTGSRRDQDQADGVDPAGRTECWTSGLRVGGAETGCQTDRAMSGHHGAAEHPAPVLGTGRLQAPMQWSAHFRIGAVAAPRTAARPAGGQEGGGEHVVAGVRIDVAILACGHRRIVGQPSRRADIWRGAGHRPLRRSHVARTGRTLGRPLRSAH